MKLVFHCLRRVMPKALTKAEFIEKARTSHGDKYDYSLVMYKNSYTKVEIICPTHKSFLQNPSNHIRGTGCIKCFHDSKRSDVETFIRGAEIIHSKGRYDYSQVVYVNNYTQVKIVCPIHSSVFLQTPSNHLNGHGCSECFRDKMRSDTETFIQKARSVHDDKYDYSKVVYVDCSTRVEIGCPNPKHKYFWQTPSDHLSGSGCNICNESKGERQVATILDKLNIPYKRQKKFTTCFRIYCLPFDFYAKFYNLCIEYDGQQHFKPVKFFGGEENFKETQESDAIKTQWCKDNNVNLLRIPYYVKDIEPLIIQKLAEISGNSPTAAY